MTLLALDTCFDGCSVALFGDDGTTVLARRLETMARGHAERLPVMVDEVFREAGVKPTTLTKVAVARGPGTFTGLRIGLSYAKGLGLALGVPVIGVDSLWAMAAPHLGQAARIAVTHKAGATGLFYAAVYDGATLAVIEAPALIDDAQRLQWNAGSLVIENTQPDATAFGAQALMLGNDDHPALPLYLREADAKPSAPAAFSTVTTRRATVDDAQLLAQIHGQSFDPSWTPEMFASALSLPGAGALIISLANSDYGFVQYQWVAGEAEINTLCVLPNYRRQGFGRAAISALMDHLRQHNTQKLFLEVADDNIAALRLYEAHGFQRTGLRKGYYARVSGAVDAITMARDL
jgi:tRNA threonylcarbamoyl adenosine modification protein YeaZ/ribosomal-protein-alanine acetyltransferase